MMAAVLGLIGAATMFIFSALGIQGPAPMFLSLPFSQLRVAGRSFTSVVQSGSDVSRRHFRHGYRLNRLVMEQTWTGGGGACKNISSAGRMSFSRRYARLS